MFPRLQSLGHNVQKPAYPRTSRRLAEEMGPALGRARECRHPTPRHRVTAAVLCWFCSDTANGKVPLETERTVAGAGIV